MAYTILWGNRPETDYSRRLAQHNQNLKEKLGVRQDTLRQTQKEDKPTAKKIAEAFSKNSEDIGRTNLITMDIDTGEHPPICQKPYTLALKHYEWVQKEVKQLE